MSFVIQRLAGLLESTLIANPSKQHGYLLRQLFAASTKRLFCCSFVFDSLGCHIVAMATQIAPSRLRPAFLAAKKAGVLGLIGSGTPIVGPRLRLLCPCGA